MEKKCSTSCDCCGGLKKGKDTSCATCGGHTKSLDQKVYSSAGGGEGLEMLDWVLSHVLSKEAGRLSNLNHPQISTIDYSVQTSLADGEQHRLLLTFRDPVQISAAYGAMTFVQGWTISTLIPILKNAQILPCRCSFKIESLEPFDSVVIAPNSTEIQFAEPTQQLVQKKDTLAPRLSVGACTSSLYQFHQL